MALGDEPGMDSAEVIDWFAVFPAGPSVYAIRTLVEGGVTVMVTTHFLEEAEYCDRIALVYRGQLDDSRPGNDKSLTGKDLRAAIDAVLADRPVSAEQKASIGCNIKWKK